MSFCPQCRCEYEKEIKTCKDCQVALVDSLGPLEEKQHPFLDEEFIIVTTETNEIEAILKKDFLENQGIPCILNTPTYWGDVPNSGWFAQNHVLVPRSKLKEAKDILESISD